MEKVECGEKKEKQKEKVGKQKEKAGKQRLKRETMKAEKEKDEEETKTLNIKRTTKDFVTMLECLNDRQKAAVKEMGFGALLQFKVKRIPGKLAYWILDNYDPVYRGIRLANKRILYIEEEDVQMTLGFPMGRQFVERSSGKTIERTLMDDVAKGFQGGKWLMKPRDVEKVMLKDVNGGEMFKKIFLLLVEGALIETSPCGNIKPKIQHFINDVENIRDLNWCG